jgi:hypothetical protein
MGQQQLLLIVIGVIIASQVLLGSMKYIDSIDQGNERDVLVAQIHSLISDAAQFQLKPATMGGGGGSMTAFQPVRNKTLTDRFRIYTTASDREVVFSGYGGITGKDEETPVHVIVTYNSDTQKAVIETIN